MVTLNAFDNRELFVELFNRYTVYAPYTLHLDGYAPFVFDFNEDKERLAIIGRCGLEQGIIHAGTFDHQWGCIYLLFADNNRMALELLRIAEKWFSKMGVAAIKSPCGFPSPYKYILHGSEPYCWAGNYHANNAFRRLGYDLEFDIIVMSMKLDGAQNNVQCPGFDIKDEVCRDDKLALAGNFNAFQNGEWAGRCGYHLLRGFSGSKRGQVDIWLDDAHHGRGLAPYLMGRAHDRLIELGAKDVMLATNQALFRAVRFYQKLGYVCEPIRAYSYEKTL